MTAAADRVVAAFLDQLRISGVRHLVVAPGSRNTPLILAMTRPQSGLRPWLHLDERSAGYFALGLARQLREPVGLVCTSGTAAANFLPAAVEARLSRVPLLLLTADRPPELRDVGAAQTIDQVRMFGSHAKWAVDMPIADGTAALVDSARATAARAAALAVAPPAGPVHVNFPFREPLVERAAAGSTPPEATPAVAVPPLRAAPDRDELEAIAAGLQGRRGIIVCGPEAMGLPPSPIVALADALGWPVLADPLSGVRAGRHRLDRVVAAYDLLVRDPAFARRATPEAVIRFGAQPTSKPLNAWLASLRGVMHILVDGAGGWRDPDATASRVVPADEASFCDALAALVNPAAVADPSWCELWTRADRVAGRAMQEAMAALEEPFEGRAAEQIARSLPDGGTLVAGNSMPVRDIDSFVPALQRDLRITGTRGASGIDGVISTAAGAAAAGGGPVALLVGDVSFFHDLNGLYPVRPYELDLTVVLVHNDGGGIFHFLPQRALVPDRFEQWFGTPHGLDFRPAVEMHGGRFVRLEGAHDAELMANALNRPGLDVLELRTDRDRNVELHRAVFARAMEAVRGALAAASSPAG